MNEVLRVESLCKEYPSFRLENVSFSVEAGASWLYRPQRRGQDHDAQGPDEPHPPSSGRIEFFGLPLEGNESRSSSDRLCLRGRQLLPAPRHEGHRRRHQLLLRQLDDALYRRYLDRFQLDEAKKPRELSEGMKVKFNLAMALSHHAELLLLDEPTSGLDPVSRDDLLEVFLDLAAEGVAILFSTHITSDLDKCAGAITYIRGGRILASEQTADLSRRLPVTAVSGGETAEQRRAFLGVSRGRDGDTALISAADAGAFAGRALRSPDLEAIMVHLEKEANHEAVLNKEIRLTASPLTWFFLLFSAMTMLPAILFWWARFLSVSAFSTPSSSAGSSTTPSTPRCFRWKRRTWCGLNLRSRPHRAPRLALMSVLTALRMALLQSAAPYTANPMMNANLAYLGYALIVFALFNALFLPDFSRPPMSSAGPSSRSSSSPSWPSLLRDSAPSAGLAALNSTGAEALQLPVLLCGAALYPLLTLFSLRRSERRFENVDL
jgi:ABC-2 type transport system ATP-binding protein